MVIVIKNIRLSHQSLFIKVFEKFQECNNYNFCNKHVTKTKQENLLHSLDGKTLPYANLSNTNSNMFEAV